MEVFQITKDDFDQLLEVWFVIEILGVITALMIYDLIGALLRRLLGIGDNMTKFEVLKQWAVEKRWVVETDGFEEYYYAVRYWFQPRREKRALARTKHQAAHQGQVM